MFSLPSSFDAWLTNAPDDNGAWEEYRERYHDRAAAIVLDCLTESLPRRLPAPEQASIRAKLQAVVDELDTATVVGWSQEVSDDAPPSFEMWCEPDRAA